MHVAQLHLGRRLDPHPLTPTKTVDHAGRVTVEADDVAALVRPPGLGKPVG
jgi:hypothetical protein